MRVLFLVRPVSRVSELFREARIYPTDKLRQARGKKEKVRRRGGQGRRGLQNALASLFRNIFFGVVARESAKSYLG